MSRKKHDTAPVTAAAALAHDLLGEEKDKPVSETRADWVEVLTDTPAPDTHHICKYPPAEPGALGLEPLEAAGPCRTSPHSYSHCRIPPSGAECTSQTTLPHFLVDHRFAA